MPQLDPLKQIDEWRAQYGIMDKIGWSGYEELGHTTLGVTRYDWEYPRISLHQMLRGHPIWTTGVLWHEFCHCAAYWEREKTPQGHGDAWKRWLWKKPLLAFINSVAPSPDLL